MTERRDLPADPDVPIGKTLDIKRIEVLARTVVRAIFGKEIRVPLKLKGVMDMDLVVRDTTVILNLNKVQMEAPELLIWRFIFAYQGKPVVEYGRGIKNDMKVHLPQLFFLLITLWRGRNKKLKTRALAGAAFDHDLVAMAAPDPKTGAVPTTTL